MKSYRQQLHCGLLCLSIGLSSTACAAVESAQTTPAVSTYRAVGEGAPVVMVHGALSDARAWDDVIDALSSTPGYHFITYHQRYYGPQEHAVGKPADFNRNTHIEDLIRLAESQGAPVTLVTWSYGGEIGLHAMQQRPELFRAAVHF